MATFNRAFLDAYIDEYLKIFPFSGMIRVTEKDEVLYERNVGFADFEKQIPFSNDSAFSFYSLSKPFCAIGLLLLYDRGLVDIDLHPSVYVPEAKGFHKDLTIRHVLHHISGLPDFEQNPTYKEKYYNDNSSDREEFERIKNFSLGVEPATRFHYANVNFILCALIIENVTNTPYREYMEKEVFAPMGVKNAVIDEEGKEIANRVQGYEVVDGTRVRVERALRWLKGAGDLVGTIDDVYRLNVAIKHRLLLKEDTWRQVLSTWKLGHFGMGCAVLQWHGREMIRHNGGHKGFRTLHRQLQDEDFDIILLLNHTTSDVREDIPEAIYTARYGLEGEQCERVGMDAGYIQVETDGEKARRLLLQTYAKF